MAELFLKNMDTSCNSVPVFIKFRPYTSPGSTRRVPQIRKEAKLQLNKKYLHIIPSTKNQCVLWKHTITTKAVITFGAKLLQAASSVGLRGGYASAMHTFSRTNHCRTNIELWRSTKHHELISVAHEKYMVVFPLEVRLWEVGVRVAWKQLFRRTNQALRARICERFCDGKLHYYRAQRYIFYIHSEVKCSLVVQTLPPLLKCQSFSPSSNINFRERKSWRIYRSNTKKGRLA